MDIQKFIKIKTNNNNIYWKDMVKRKETETNIFENDYKISYDYKWIDIKTKCMFLKEQDVFTFVNNIWNKKLYKTDKTLFHKEDYWQTPFQFSRNGGDCEDYAIAKYFTLKELGIDTSRMKILIGETKKGVHAVLMIDDSIILDNDNKSITAVDNYDMIPKCSLNENFGWSYIKKSSS